MTTAFSKLPIIDLSALSSPDPSQEDLRKLSKEVYNVFATVGFAYVINAPLTFSHEDVFALARDFFSLDDEVKMELAKQTFVPTNRNTYRGYFPQQPGRNDNLKEGFEIGSRSTSSKSTRRGPQETFDLAEPNVWPEESSLPTGRARMEQLRDELQGLSSVLLSLLAVSLGKSPDHFSPWLVDSLSTLRMLHYPPQQTRQGDLSDEAQLCCTPHTDSGILTLLHQDPTGGLEVLNASGEWIAAPYIPGSIVVNIGDLFESVSGGRFVATKHRVRSSPGKGNSLDGLGRLSVPFFFEPGEECVVRGVDGGEGVVYGEHVRGKMSTWVEYQDVPERAWQAETGQALAVEG